MYKMEPGNHYSSIGRNTLPGQQIAGLLVFEKLDLQEAATKKIADLNRTIPDAIYHFFSAAGSLGQH